MAHDAGRDGLEKQASAHLSQSIRQAFCTTVNASGLPPMTVLKLAALALGMIYREAAAAHRGLNGCPCGWQPENAADLDSLQAALTVGALADTGLDLRTVQAVGRA